MHNIPQTAKYIPSPALYARVAAPTDAANSGSVPGGAKLAANPIEGCTMIPYAVQNPPAKSREVR